jgi:predicted 3-demethylubiquinone-9 3-methyltransferase (glyoxalase superfamily)
MQKTITFLMFVGEQCGKAQEAIELYTSVFPGSELKEVEYFKAGEPGGNEGDVKQAIFTLAGQEYRAMDSAMGHQFTFTPSISIFVNCETEAEIDRLFSLLSEGGAVMMPLNDYAFSKKFAWIADRYGVSWQLNLE